MKPVSLSLGVICLGIALCPRVAVGQTRDADKAAAVALFDQAEKLMAEKSYAAACSKYAESNRLDPQLGALLHLADCYEKNGQLASAWASWRDAVESAQKRSDPREKIAKERADALEPKLSKLVIEVPSSSDVPGLEIRRDGTVVSRSLWSAAIPVDAGEHVIEVTAPGKKKVVAKVDVGPDGAIEKHQVEALEDDPTAASSGPTAAVGPGTQGPAQTSHGISSAGATQRTLGWIAGGLGVIGVGAGLVFELQRSSKVTDREAICPSGKDCTTDEKTRIDGLNEDVDKAVTLETVSFVAGGVLLAGGAVLLLTAPSGERPSSGRWMVGPSVARGTLGVAAIGSW